MLSKVKRRWRSFAAEPAGQRFKAAYQRQHRGTHSVAAKVAWLAAGLALVVIGGVFLVIPGPGLPVVLVGGALIARQSRPIASFLDKLEVLVRRLWRKASGWWKKAPLTLRAALVVMVLAAAGGAAWVVWQRFVVR